MNIYVVKESMEKRAALPTNTHTTMKLLNQVWPSLYRNGYGITDKYNLFAIARLLKSKKLTGDVTKEMSGLSDRLANADKLYKTPKANAFYRKTQTDAANNAVRNMLATEGLSGYHKGKAYLKKLRDMDISHKGYSRRIQDMYKNVLDSYSDTDAGLRTARKWYPPMYAIPLFGNHEISEQLAHLKEVEPRLKSFRAAIANKGKGQAVAQAAKPTVQKATQQAAKPVAQKSTGTAAQAASKAAPQTTTAKSRVNYKDALAYLKNMFKSKAPAEAAKPAAKPVTKPAVQKSQAKKQPATKQPAPQAKAAPVKKQQVQSKPTKAPAKKSTSWLPFLSKQKVPAKQKTAVSTRQKNIDIMPYAITGGAGLGTDWNLNRKKGE